jgi:hypothetical protein
VRVQIVGVVPTHLMSMVPLTWALRSAGHEILVSGNAAVVERARLAGLSGAVVPDPPRRQAPAPATAAPSPPADGAGAPLDWAAMEERWRHRVGAVVGHHLRIARAWRPDLILCDPIEFSGLVVAGSLNVPAVVHRWGADRISSSTLARAPRALAEIGVRHGVPDGIPLPALVLDPCPPTLQCPDAGHAQPIRFLPFNGVGSLPEWVFEQSPPRRIAVSFGSDSGLLADPARWKALVSALASIDGLESVITSSPPPESDPLPANVRAEGPVPLNLFLSTCAAVLHHGGSGTCLTAIHYGLPQLVFDNPNPSYRAHAERVEACGAGRTLHLDGEDGTSDAWRAAVWDVLTDPGYRETAERLREEMYQQPAPHEIVSILGELAGTGAFR